MQVHIFSLYVFDQRNNSSHKCNDENADPKNGTVFAGSKIQMTIISFARALLEKIQIPPKCHRNAPVA